MHETEKFNELKCLKDRLIQLVSAQLDCGIEKINTEELGEVVDMIKDLAHAEKKCWEAKYYESIVKAMDEYEDDPEMLMAASRMGYNPNRSVTGRYDTRGGDHTVPGWRSRGGYPYYPMDDKLEQTQPYMMDEDMRHGKPYNDYKAWKRNYTASKSLSDKSEMDRHAMEHVQDTVTTMKEIWGEADPELKRKMKADVTKLLNEMN